MKNTAVKEERKDISVTVVELFPIHRRSYQSQSTIRQYGFSQENSSTPIVSGCAEGCDYKGSKYYSKYLPRP